MTKLANRITKEVYSKNVAVILKRGKGVKIEEETNKKKYKNKKKEEK